MHTAIASPISASTLTADGDDVNFAEIAADEEEVECAVPNGYDADKVLQTASASPSSLSTLSAVEDQVHCAQIAADEAEFKSVR